MKKSSWSIIIALIFVIIIIIIALAIYLSNHDVKANIENFVENVSSKGIMSLLDEYSGDMEKENVTQLYDNNLHTSDNVDISVTDIPEAFLRDSGIVSMDFESSGVKRTKPEGLCKKVLQRLYKKKFSRVRPSWLRNPKTNRPLELDCYNEELGIALEYNGIAHYKWPNWTKMTKDEFLDQVERDRFKLDACDEHGVYLIVVPYNIPHNLIPDFIEYQLPHNVQRRREMQESSGY